MNGNQKSSLVATVMWGIYGILVGMLIVIMHYAGIYAWISIIVAVVGNSAHLMTLHLSKSGLSVSDLPLSKNVGNRLG